MSDSDPGSDPGDEATPVTRQGGSGNKGEEGERRGLTYNSNSVHSRPYSVDHRTRPNNLPYIVDELVGCGSSRLA